LGTHILRINEKCLARQNNNNNDDDGDCYFEQKQIGFNIIRSCPKNMRFSMK